MHRIARRWAGPLLVAAAACGLPGPASAAPAGRQAVTAGAVTATLSWSASKHSYDAPVDPRLRIDRGGAPALDAGIGDVCDHCYFNGTQEEPNITLRDLDGDGEPEVLVDTFSGGAHCCFGLGLWDFRPELGTYGHSVRAFGNGGYALQDLDGDGKPEFLSDDDRFAYTFAAYVFSVRPVQVLRWSRTPQIGFTDVTRQFPKPIEQQAAELRKTLRARSKDVDLRGPLAAYVADMYLLGRGSEGRTEIARVRRRHRLGSARDGIWPGGRRFEPALLAFLKASGYR